MKKKLILASLMALSLNSLPVLADCSQKDGHDGTRLEEQKERQEHKIERMTTELNLSSDQQAKIRAIYEEKENKMRSIHEETQNEVLAVLNKKQQAKYKEFKAKHMEKMEKHDHDSDHGNVK